MKRTPSFLALGTMLAVACAACAANGPTHARYATLPPHGGDANHIPSAQLQTWNGSFTYQGKSTPFTMVGTDPSSTNTTTTVNVFIVPVNICIGSGSTKTCFDPNTKQSNGQTVTQNVLNSPVFMSQDYTQGGTDIGNTQYEDAFQRASFWTDVMTNTNYHVLLKPVLVPEQTLNVPAADGSVQQGQFGVPSEANVDMAYLDTQINNSIPKLKHLTPASLLLVLTYDTYLTQGDCCLGGYHSATLTNQTYAEFTYTTPTSGTSYAEDVSALSNEIGEWYDDPLVNNSAGPNPNCNGGLLEVGDPIENELGLHPYGDFTYTFNGLTYHLHDLMLLQYFGQTPSTSVNGFWTFQGQTVLPGEGKIGVCSFGQ